jgi:hypothetical protein
LLFQRFFETISSLLPERTFVGDPDALAKLDPNKIYIENVRSVFQISSRSAERYCEAAVRQGVFLKFVEVHCPDGAVAASSEFEKSLPEKVRCWKEEHGNYEELWIPTRDLSKTVFYRLNDEAASTKSYPRTNQGLRSHSA